MPQQILRVFLIVVAPLMTHQCDCKTLDSFILTNTDTDRVWSMCCMSCVLCGKPQNRLRSRFVFGQQWSNAVFPLPVSHMPLATCHMLHSAATTWVVGAGVDIVRGMNVRRATVCGTLPQLSTVYAWQKFGNCCAVNAATASIQTNATTGATALSCNELNRYLPHATKCS